MLRNLFTPTAEFSWARDPESKAVGVSHSAVSHHARLIASLVRRGWFTFAEAVFFQSKGSSLTVEQWGEVEAEVKQLINQN